MNWQQQQKNIKKTYTNRYKTKASKNCKSKRNGNRYEKKKKKRERERKALQTVKRSDNVFLLP